MKSQVSLIWFRNDLRLHDHEALTRAIERSERVLPVYCFDPRHWGKTAQGFDKTGPFRTQFLLESVAELRNSLRQRGSELLICQGKPEVLLPELARAYGASKVFAHQEVTSEELKVEERVEKALFAQGATLERCWGATLFHREDLPMPVSSLPEVFTNFRKQVEKLSPVRKPFPTPSRISTPPVDAPGTLPAPEALGQAHAEADARAVLAFVGGENAALERLNEYFWEKDCLKVYKETRDGLLGADYSSKFSPWLALGCISPRKIYWEVQRYESLRKKNESTYWLVFELIWRDYFRFIAKKHGNALFFAGGLKGSAPEGRQDWGLFQRWREGQTGVPFVDANMRELLLTGFMSNRGRQNVASFLVRDLGLDWRMGAEYFESQLIDYDVCSNWGNWNYVAGVGNDPRENRYFNVIAQGKRYDGRGEYVRAWLPELSQVPSQFIHEPFLAYPNQLRSWGVSLGGNYPHPVVAPGGQSQRA